MAKMMNPELEVVRFENEDVISASVWLVAYKVDDVTYYRVYTPNGYSEGKTREEAATLAAQYYSTNGQPSENAISSIYVGIDPNNPSDQSVTHDGDDDYSVRPYQP